MIITTRDPFCERCYAESAARAAALLPDHASREILLRAARARIELAGTRTSEASHARHPRRRAPWPSETLATA